MSIVLESGFEADSKVSMYVAFVSESYLPINGEESL